MLTKVTIEQLQINPIPHILVKYYSNDTSVGILRIARDCQETLWAALTFLRMINKRLCSIQVIHVSGKYSFFILIVYAH